jgi:predicted porin
MKKTLIAIAAFAATAAFAQSSVTIGGQLDAGYSTSKVSSSSTTSTTANSISGGNFGASRMWFKGSEDMGGGLKTNFELQMQPNLTNGSNEADGIFNRGAWLGLSGNFGEIKMGRQSTSTTGLICGIIDQHGCYGSFSGAGVLLGANGKRIISGNAGGVGTGTNATTAAGSTRYNRAITYATPVIAGGFTAQVDYAFNGTPMTGNNASNSGGAGKTTALGMNYAAGPLAVGFNIQRADLDPTVTTQTASTNTLGVKYDLGMAVLRFGYQRGSNTGTPSDDHKAYSLSALFPMGAARPYIAMNRGSQTSNSAGVSTDVNSNKVFNIGMLYAMSKRTDFYADWAKDSGRSGTAAAGYDLNGSILSMGLRHNF